MLSPSTSKSNRGQKRKKKSDFNKQGQADNIINMISAEQAKVTKPSTSKSSRRKGNFVQKSKQGMTRNWLDVPSDVMENILSRIGVYDILDNAQKVCTTWHRICKEPAMWRTVSMDYSHRWRWPVFRKICKHVVDRSQGQMVDISIDDFCDDDFLRYIADSSGQNSDAPDLRHLELIKDTMTNVGLRMILDGCRHLELLDLHRCKYIDLKGDLGKRCSEQIKHLKLPDDEYMYV
uniref:putative F-box/LRR-repeat protein 23 n=1 Tax=Erigeron canadensis TaxID=72917 RepID=UPI001CB98513|nr:putative F-box/LRR-repeat protein 23 [Erigeron canadensis]